LCPPYGCWKLSAKRANINNRGWNRAAMEPTGRTPKTPSPKGATQPKDFLVMLVRPLRGRWLGGGLSVGSVARASRLHPRLFIFAHFVDISPALRTVLFPSTSFIFRLSQILALEHQYKNLDDYIANQLPLLDL
jgi:hypothetical protein